MQALNFVSPRHDNLAKSCNISSGADIELTNLNWLSNLNFAEVISNQDNDKVPTKNQQTWRKDSENHGVKLPRAARLIKHSLFDESWIDYNPNVDPSKKPPYSFSCLIFLAIESAKDKSLPVKGIYKWIQQNFPYFRTVSDSWKNSVRHNLSLNRCFVKISVCKNIIVR